MAPSQTLRSCKCKQAEQGLQSFHSRLVVKSSVGKAQLWTAQPSQSYPTASVTRSLLTASLFVHPRAGFCVSSCPVARRGSKPNQTKPNHLSMSMSRPLHLQPGTYHTIQYCTVHPHPHLHLPSLGLLTASFAPSSTLFSTLLSLSLSFLTTTPTTWRPVHSSCAVFCTTRSSSLLST